MLRFCLILHSPSLHPRLLLRGRSSPNLGWSHVQVHRARSDHTQLFWQERVRISSVGAAQVLQHIWSYFLACEHGAVHHVSLAVVASQGALGHPAVVIAPDYAPDPLDTATHRKAGLHVRHAGRKGHLLEAARVCWQILHIEVLLHQLEVVLVVVGAGVYTRYTR